MRMERILFFSVVGSVILVSSIGLALLFYVETRSDEEALRTRLRAAAESGSFQNDYPTVGWFQRLDMFTECGALSMALNPLPTLRSVLLMHGFQGCAGLRRVLLENEPLPTNEYAHYWHGHQIILKPLYTAFPVPVARGILTAVGLFLWAGLWCAAAYRLGAQRGAVLALSLIIPGGLTVFPLATHAVPFWLVLLSSIVACLWRGRSVPVPLFAIIGALSTFVSFLNMESLSLGLPLLCYFCVQLDSGRSAASLVKESSWLCFAWGAAFVGMWLSKWGMGTLGFLSAKTVYLPHSFAMIGQALSSNILNMPWTIALGTVMLMALRMWWCALKPPRGSWALLVPAAVPLVWICLLPGHAEIHNFFMKIILWPTVAALLYTLWGEKTHKVH